MSASREKKYPYTQTDEGVFISMEHYLKFLDEKGLGDRKAKESMKEYMRLSNEEDGFAPGEGPQSDDHKLLQLRATLDHLTRKQAKEITKMLRDQGLDASLVRK